MKITKIALLSLFLIFSGCASVVAPQTPKQSLYYVVSMVQSASTSLIQNSESFTPEQSRQLADSLQEATEAVNSARIYIDIYDKTGAVDAKDEALRRIQQAQVIVNALQSIMSNAK